MLAEDAVENEQWDNAILLLALAYLGCDGASLPFELVVGEAVPELNAMIVELLLQYYGGG